MGRHAQVVVAAPDGDGLGGLRGEAGRERRPFGEARHFLEDAVRVVLFLAQDLLVEERAVLEACEWPGE